MLTRLLLALALAVPLAASVAHRTSADSSFGTMNSTHSPLVSQRPTPIDLCSAGTFILSAAGTRLGQETYRVDCHPDGTLSAKGHTQLTLPTGVSDIESTITLDASRLPRAITATGHIGPTSIDQRVEIANGTGTVTNGTVTHQISIPPDASYLPRSNVFYVAPFIIARYDATKEGEQRIPVWPGGVENPLAGGSVLVSYAGADQVKDTSGNGTVRFDRYTMQVGPQHLVLWFDSAGRIAIIALPAQQFVAARSDLMTVVGPLEQTLAASPTGAASASVSYAAPPGAPYTSEDVTVQGPGYTLAGTLLLPKNGTRPYPAAVMITGSGLQDRDEALGIPGLEQYRPFRQIAETLATAGIAVLRVDDRGFGQSTGAATLDSATTSSFASDTKLQVAYLRTRPDIDGARIALIGHSEGANIAAMVAAQDPRIAAIVLMGGTAEPGGKISIKQLQFLLAHDTTQTAAQKEALIEQQREVVKKVDAGQDIPGQRNMKWVHEYFTYDPLPTIRKVHQPILILQGGHDQQVPPDQAIMLATAAREAGNQNVTEHAFPTLNHLFLPSATGAVSEYSSLKVTNLGDDVLDTIRDWLVKALRVDK